MILPKRLSLLQVDNNSLKYICFLKYFLKCMFLKFTLSIDFNDISTCQGLFYA